MKTASDTKCECACHLSDGMYNHDATEPCPSCHNTANEKARKIWKKICDDDNLDGELVIAAALREYGEAVLAEKLTMPTKELDKLQIEIRDEWIAEGFQRGQNVHLATCAEQFEEGYRRGKSEGRAETIEEVSKIAIQALNDWIVSYAPEFCDEKSVKETSKRIQKHGTLAYIADAIESIRALLPSEGKGERHE